MSDRSVLLVDSIWIGVLRILLLLAEDKLDWKSYTTPKSISHDEPKLGYPHSIGKIIIFFAYVTLLRMETSHFAVSNRPMNVKYFLQSLFHPGSGSRYCISPYAFHLDRLQAKIMCLGFGSVAAFVQHFPVALVGCLCLLRFYL